MMVVLIVVVAILLVTTILSLLRARSLQGQVCQLQKSYKMMATFVKALGREIRTPLHSVSGMAEIIAREDLYLSKGEKKTISDQIKYNTGMIATLLDEIGIYSEGGEGHHLQDERFSPNQLIQRCLDGNRVFLQEGVKLSFRHDLSDSQFVSADRHIVEVVLNKLVFSACKFTKHGEVAVGCRQGSSASLLTFYVEDTGGGIPENRKGKVFSWFDNPDDMFDETEFDLSVAQRLASKIGGYLRFDERYQGGTRIEFTIPVR